MSKTVAKMFLFSLVFISTFAGAALVPTQFPDAVVALGSMIPVPFPNQPPVLYAGQPCLMQWSTEGTGFLYGYLTQGDPDPTKRKYQVFLVTNRHVIEEHASALAISKLSQVQLQPSIKCTLPPITDDSISVRVNPLKSSLQGRSFDLPIKDWFFHQNKDVDIAAILLNADFLKTEGLMDLFFANDLFAYNKEQLRTNGVAAGDGVFVLGFPMNMTGVQRNYVIVRQGCIARISEMLDGASPTFLVDAFVFPGNSGSPVILRPDVTSITGTPAQTKANLIGIIRSYQPYDEMAVSPQTKRPRVIFEENSGLAEVLPTDYIDEAITAWRKANQPKQ
jgi:hypothetical protein